MSQLHPRMIDRAARALRIAHLRRNGIEPRDALPWDRLQASEQDQWRDRALNARPAQ